MRKPKRVAAINDISGFGKCSLTVVLPILSAAGLETAIMPTALLSTHTGGLGECFYKDLTDEMVAFMEHWKSLEPEFDAIYSGYLASENQIDIISEFIDIFKKDNTVVLVDPAMGDNGKLYSRVTPEIAAKMAKLCGKADIIVPNITEAAMLLGEEYVAGPYEKKYLEGLAARLNNKFGAKVVLTGVDLGDGKIGALTFDKNAEYTFAPKTEGHYHGTGDAFAAVLLGAYLNGRSLGEAAELAVQFVADSIERTAELGTDSRFGLNFEQGIPALTKKLGL